MGDAAPDEPVAAAERPLAAPDPGEPFADATGDPIVTDLGPSRRSSEVKRKVNKVVETIVPLVIAGLVGFFLYAYAYVILWGHVRKQNRGAAIALLVLFVVLVAYIGLIWAMIFLVGPGKVDETYPAAGTDDDPFLCDADGYALWCTYCKHIKPSKTHHSSATDTCVPVMDHFCVWIGGVIGQRNRKLFIQFAAAMWATLVLMLVSMFVFQHGQLPHISAFAVPVYVLSGFWVSFVTAVLMQHAKYLYLYQTTIDMLDVRRNRTTYVNLPVGDTRRVVALSKKDDLVPGPFATTPWKDICRVMGPLWLWLVPTPSFFYGEPAFNPQAVAALQERALREMKEEEEHRLAPVPSKVDVPPARRRLHMPKCGARRARPAAKETV